MHPRRRRVRVDYVRRSIYIFPTTAAGWRGLMPPPRIIRLGGVQRTFLENRRSCRKPLVMLRPI